MAASGCSRPLQRVIVDFAADRPFAQVRSKLREHYGFEIGESTIQRITFAHAQSMFEAGRADLEFPEGPGLSKPIVVETDGGMVPIVEPVGMRKTNARARTCRGERRLAAHAQGSRTPVYAGSIEGGAEAAGLATAGLRGSRRLRGELAGPRGRRWRAMDGAKSRSNLAIKAAT